MILPAEGEEGDLSFLSQIPTKISYCDKQTPAASTKVSLSKQFEQLLQVVVGKVATN